MWLLSSFFLEAIWNSYQSMSGEQKFTFPSQIGSINSRLTTTVTWFHKMHPQMRNARAVQRTNDEFLPNKPPTWNYIEIKRKSPVSNMAETLLVMTKVFIDFNIGVFSPIVWKFRCKNGRAFSGNGQNAAFINRNACFDRIKPKWAPFGIFRIVAKQAIGKP